MKDETILRRSSLIGNFSKKKEFNRFLVEKNDERTLTIYKFFQQGFVRNKQFDIKSIFLQFVNK